MSQVNYTLLQEIYVAAAQEALENPSSGSSSSDDSGVDVGWWEYSDNQLRILGAVYYVTPPFSLVGSILVVYVAILALRRRRSSSMKPSALRLLCGFALLDIVHTTGYLILGPWAVPKGTPWVPAASGNVHTCNAKGFFQNLLLGLWVYAAGLALYHTCQVRTSWTEDTLRRIEVCVHAVAWIFPLLTASVYLPLGMFNPTPGIPGLCWVAAFPADCDDHEQVDCLRGQYWRIPSLTAALLSFAAFWIILVCMVLIVLRVRYTEQRIARFTRSASGLHSSSASQLELTKATGRQAVLYIVSFWVSNFVLYLKWLVEEGSATMDFVLNVLFFLCLPLHGFLHAFIFLSKNQHLLSTGRDGVMAAWTSSLRRMAHRTSTSLALSANAGGPSSKFQDDVLQQPESDVDIEPISIPVGRNGKTTSDDSYDDEGSNPQAVPEEAPPQKSDFDG